MLVVLRLRHPLKVRCSVIRSNSVFVVHHRAILIAIAKGLRNQTMNAVLLPVRKNDLQIAIRSIDEWPQRYAAYAPCSRSRAAPNDVRKASHTPHIAYLVVVTGRSH